MALSHFISENDYQSIALGTRKIDLEESFKLSEIMDKQEFEGLSEQLASQVTDSEPHLAILLLDKIGSHSKVLDLLINRLEKRERPVFFCAPGLHGVVKCRVLEQRVTLLCSRLLETYRKKGMESKFAKQYEVLWQMDKACEAFDMLNVDPQDVKDQLLWNVLEQLNSLRFIPSFKKTTVLQLPQFAADFKKRHTAYQAITSDVLICKAKCIWKLHTLIKGPGGFVIDKEKQKLLKELGDHLDLCLSYAQQLSMNSPELSRCFDTIKQISLEII